MMGGILIMMNSSENMFWSDINNVKRFSENTKDNKNKQARKTSSIILASVQLMENFIKGIKHMNAYDASSTILSDANWIQKSTFKSFKDDNGFDILIEPGKVYYIDYGKTFNGELAYFHYGLCIGKRDGKILVVPITSGKDYFSSAYHPINNPNANKKNRQALQSEGFGKDCVLKINDTKYISAGRIESESITISNDILLQIQKQVFQVQFPKLYNEYYNQQKIIEKNKKQISEQKEVIQKLKNDNNRLNQVLKSTNKLDLNKI